MLMPLSFRSLRRLAFWQRFLACTWRIPLATIAIVQASCPNLRAEEMAFPKPSLNPSGIESAFIANQGDYFIYATGYGYELQSWPGHIDTDGHHTWKKRTSWVLDGGLGAGFGLGSSKDLIAVQIGYNLNGIRGPDLGGTIDVKLARDLVSTKDLKVGIGAGILGILSHGQAAESGSTPFVVSTLALPIAIADRERTMQMNFGYGGGKFRDVGSPDILEQGVFASVGLEVADNLGMSVGWSGRGLNATVSVTPLRGVPLAVGMSANNLSNHDQQGRSAVLSLSWGGTFQTASFPSTP